MLGDVSYAIVGVAPAGFDGSSAGWAADVFVPNREVFSDAALANRTPRHRMSDRNRAGRVTSR
jgi:hypothetical protein